MDANSFLKKFGKDEAGRVAEAAGTTYLYFYQIALGHRRPSVDLATRLESESGGRMEFAALLRAKRRAA